MLCIVQNNNKVMIENSPPLHQTYTLTVVWKYMPKIGPFNRRQVVHPRPQTPQGESVAKPETPLLIILRAVCKCHIKEVHINYSNPFF